jgi:hypothetical protein
LLCLIAKGFICIIIPNLIFILIFYRSEEFQYIKNVLKNVVSGRKVKLTSTS